MNIAFECLAKKPELEDRHLEMIVNKFGDPVKRIASKTSYLLLLLLEEHPDMTFVVVKAVESFIIQPSISNKAKYDEIKMY